MSDPGIGAPGRRRRMVVAISLPILLIGLVAFAVLRIPPKGRQRRENISRAERALRAGNVEEARVLYARLVDEVPEHLTFRQKLIHCLVSQGRLDEAAAVAQGSVDIDPEYAPAHACLALVARGRGDLDAAVEEARLAAEGRKVPQGAQIVLADILLEAGRQTEGVRELARAVELGQGGEVAEARLAVLVGESEPGGISGRRARRSLELALRDAELALDEEPGRPELAERFARLALVLRRPEPAYAALEVLPNPTGEQRLLIARAHAASGRREEAAKLVSSLLESESLPRKDLVLALLTVGDVERARELIDSELESSPGDVALLRLRLAALRLAAETGPPEAELAGEILAAATELLTVRPRDERGLEARILARLSRGETEAALADTTLLRETAKDSPSAAWLHGLALLRLGDADGALSLLAEGRGAARNQAGATRWIIRAALAAGDANTAMRESLGLGAPEDAALRAAAFAAKGDFRAAEAEARADGFGVSPAGDRVRAALILAAGGRPAVARALAAEAAETPEDLLRRGDLHRALDDEDAARADYEAAARADGPIAVAALIRIGEGILRAEPLSRPAFEDVCGRLEGREGGKPRAHLLRARAALLEKDGEAAVREARAALGERPHLPEAHGILITALRAAGAEAAELQEAARNALAVAPGLRPARLVRAESELTRARESIRSGELVEAEARLDAATGFAPEAGLLRGLFRVDRGDLAEAEQDAELLSSRPETEGAGKFLLGVVRLRQGLPEEALRELKASAALLPGATDPLAAQGVALLRLRRGEEALSVAETWLEKHPGSWAALQLKASALAMLGREEEALEALRAGGDVAELRFHAGVILLWAGKPVEAAEEFRAFLESRPDAVLGHAYLVVALLDAGKIDEAHDTAEAVLEREGLRIVGHFLRARVRRLRGDMDGEFEDLEAALTVAPNDARAHALYAEGLLARGREEEGRSSLRTASGLNPSDHRIRLRLATLADRDGRVHEAMEIYESVLKIQPGNAVAANNLAYHLRRVRSEAERAVDLARLAVELEPEDGNFRDTLALTLSSAGRHEDAAKAIEEALRLLPQSAQTAENAATIFHFADREDAAARLAARAMALTPDEAKREHLRLRLREIGVRPSPK